MCKSNGTQSDSEWLSYAKCSLGWSTSEVNDRMVTASLAARRREMNRDDVLKLIRQWHSSERDQAGGNLLHADLQKSASYFCLYTLTWELRKLHCVLKPRFAANGEVATWTNASPHDCLCRQFFSMALLGYIQPKCGLHLLRIGADGMSECCSGVSDSGAK